MGCTDEVTGRKLTSRLEEAKELKVDVTSPNNEEDSSTENELGVGVNIGVNTLEGVVVISITDIVDCTTSNELDGSNDVTAVIDGVKNDGDSLENITTTLLDDGR